jgi:hypothetical protein
MPQAARGALGPAGPSFSFRDVSADGPALQDKHDRFIADQMVWSEFVEEDHKKYEADTYFQVFSPPPWQGRVSPCGHGGRAQLGAGAEAGIRCALSLCPDLFAVEF